MKNKLNYFPIPVHRFFSPEFQKLPLDEKRHIMITSGMTKKQKEEYVKLKEKRKRNKARRIDRQMAMLILRKDGKTLIEIGRIYHLTRERVRQILRQKYE